MDIQNNQLLLGGLKAIELVSAFGSPLYVYEAQSIRDRCRELISNFANLKPELHYAMKANNNPAILQTIRQEGLGVDAVSPWEVRLALELGFEPSQILFTGNYCDEADYRYCIEQNVGINVGSLSELECYGRLNPDSPIAIRLNPEIGAGHHPHVITGGPHAKFGIPHDATDQILMLLKKYNLELVGVHSHIGTGILESKDMLQAIDIIFKAALPFKDLHFIDIGGGLGIPYHPDQNALPLQALGKAIDERFSAFCTQYGRPLRLKMEPGRFIVGQAGTLLCTVTHISSTSAYTFVGSDSGFNHLIRPLLYGSYHEIINATHVAGEQQAVVITGNICESGDLFTRDQHGAQPRNITAPHPGHILAILDAGAYGYSLASEYNMRPKPAEILILNNQATLIRKRQTYQDMLSTALFQ